MEITPSESSGKQVVSHQESFSSESSQSESTKQVGSTTIAEKSSNFASQELSETVEKSATTSVSRVVSSSKETTPETEEPSKALELLNKYIGDVPEKKFINRQTSTTSLEEDYLKRLSEKHFQNIQEMIDKLPTDLFDKPKRPPSVQPSELLHLFQSVQIAQELNRVMGPEEEKENQDDIPQDENSTRENKPIDLEKLFTPASDSGEITPARSRKMFASSSFYSPIHPTVEDQVQLARRISSSLCDISNKQSKGQSMYVNRMKRSVKWVHGGEEKEGAENGISTEDGNLAFKIPSVGPKEMKLTPDPLKLIMNPHGKVQDINSLSKQGQTIQSPLTPEKCFDLVRDLNNTKGKGAELFAKRRKRSEKWVVDETNVKQTTTTQSSVSLLEKTYTQNTTRQEQLKKINEIQERFSQPRLKLIKSPWEAALETGSVDTAFEATGPVFPTAAPTERLPTPARATPINEGVQKQALLLPNIPRGWGSAQTRQLTYGSVKPNQTEIKEPPPAASSSAFINQTQTSITDQHTIGYKQVRGPQEPLLRTISPFPAVFVPHPKTTSPPRDLRKLIHPQSLRPQPLDQKQTILDEKLTITSQQSSKIETTRLQTIQTEVETQREAEKPVQTEEKETERGQEEIQVQTQGEVNQVQKEIQARQESENEVIQKEEIQVHQESKYEEIQIQTQKEVIQVQKEEIEARQKSENEEIQKIQEQTTQPEVQVQNPEESTPLDLGPLNLDKEINNIDNEIQNLTREMDSQEIFETILSDENKFIKEQIPENVITEIIEEELIEAKRLEEMLKQQQETALLQQQQTQIQSELLQQQKKEEYEKMQLQQEQQRQSDALQQQQQKKEEYQKLLFQQEHLKLTPYQIQAREEKNKMKMQHLEETRALQTIHQDEMRKLKTEQAGIIADLTLKQQRQNKTLTEQQMSQQLEELTYLQKLQKQKLSQEQFIQQQRLRQKQKAEEKAMQIKLDDLDFAIQEEFHRQQEEEKRLLELKKYEEEMKRIKEEKERLLLLEKEREAVLKIEKQKFLQEIYKEQCLKMLKEQGIKLSGEEMVEFLLGLGIEVSLEQVEQFGAEFEAEFQETFQIQKEPEKLAEPENIFESESVVESENLFEPEPEPEPEPERRQSKPAHQIPGAVPIFKNTTQLHDEMQKRAPKDADVPESGVVYESKPFKDLFETFEGNSRPVTKLKHITENPEILRSLSGVDINESIHTEIAQQKTETFYESQCSTENRLFTQQETIQKTETCSRAVSRAGSTARLNEMQVAQQLSDLLKHSEPPGIEPVHRPYSGLGLREPTPLPVVNPIVQESPLLLPVYQPEISNERVSTNSPARYVDYTTLNNFNTAPRGWKQNQDYYRPVTFTPSTKLGENLIYSDY